MSTRPQSDSAAPTMATRLVLASSAAHLEAAGAAAEDLGVDQIANLRRIPLAGALRRGDLATAFESPFDRLLGDDPISLPGGLMTLVHRVETLDPTGLREQEVPS